MKTLLIILSTVFISICSIQAQENGSMIEYNNTEREIPLKDFKPDKPISRSIIPQVAHAYLYNKVISISFEEVMQIVTIKITIESIGETVYSQEYINPTVVSIDLNMQDSDTYHIEIISDYNPQIQISVVSGTKRSIFRQKNKTKRSKKRLHTTLIKPEQKVNEDLCSGFIVS